MVPTAAGQVAESAGKLRIGLGLCLYPVSYTHLILIKISDRLHNMRTMEYQTPEKQKQKSFETMEIYAPIAHRLGMQKMKWELEDLSLKYLDPVGYPVSYTHLAW